MRVATSLVFKRQFKKAPPEIQRRAEKALRLLVNNLRHPSLRAKIFDEPRRIWQIRVNISWRIYLQISGDLYKLIALKRHR